MRGGLMSEIQDAGSGSSWDDRLWSELKVWLETWLARPAWRRLPREDIVSETLLRLFVASKTREIRFPFAYARIVLQNVVRDRIQNLEKAEAALALLAEELGCRPPENDGDGNLDDKDLVAFLLMQSSLTPIQAKVIRMRYIDEMRVIEIARELGKNPGTIAVHIDHAIDKMARRASQLKV